MSEGSLLIIRLGAMGDIIHALPSAASLRAGYPGRRIVWAVEPKWTPLLEQNPDVDSVVAIDRSSWSAVRASRRSLLQHGITHAVDLQGLLKSALTGASVWPKRFHGFDRTQAREPLASFFYSDRVHSNSIHAVDRYLDIAVAAGGKRCLNFAIPTGKPEGELPLGGFVLANPFAGWGSKQWPLRHYAELAKHLSLPLVLNVPPALRASIENLPGIVPHVSGLPGLIDATRRATAVIGVDSGPLHLAAALGKPGVAIFGPTDPARNGPYGGSLTVLRSDAAETTYKRHSEVSGSMQAISPATVVAALERSTQKQ